MSLKMAETCRWPWRAGPSRRPSVRAGMEVAVLLTTHGLGGGGGRLAPIHRLDEALRLVLSSSPRFYKPRNTTGKLNAENKMEKIKT